MASDHGGLQSSSPTISNEEVSQRSYSIISESQLRQRQEHDIARVSTILSESRATVIILLRHFSWSVINLFDRWCDDEAGLRAKLGLFVTPIVDFPPSHRPFTCPICLETFPHAKNATASASCGHLYCKTCWGSYIASSITGDGLRYLSLPCPSPSCPASAGEDMIEALAVTPSVKEKFSRFLLRSYVEDSYRRRRRWCPAPDCDYAFEFISSDFERGREGNGSNCVAVECRCSHSFCGNCGEEVHRPASCSAAVKWVAKNGEEEDSMKWIVLHTKACPQCKRPIEKGKGCSHMKCPAPCGYEFCWKCLGMWTGVSTHLCKKRLDEVADGERAELKISPKKALSKSMYEDCYNQWSMHMRSRLKATMDLKELQGERLGALEMHYGKKGTSLGIIVHAWREIIRCRKLLQWSSVYSYYFLEDKPEKKPIFEHLQEFAEFSLERLHELAGPGLEKFLAAQGSYCEFVEFRRKLLHLTCVTGNYFDKWVNALEDGFFDVSIAPASGLPLPSSPQQGTHSE